MTSIERVPFYSGPGLSAGGRLRQIRRHPIAAYLLPCRQNGHTPTRVHMRPLPPPLLTGRYLGGECTGAEKALRIGRRYDLGQYREIYAYGDTAEDREMLALANRRYYRWKEADEYEPAS